MQAIVPVASCARVWSPRSAISRPGVSSPRSRWSSRIARAREAIASSIPEAFHFVLESVTQERADAFDRLEVVAGAQRADGAAVRERLVDGEVEAVLALLEL